jgi:hypothetical protein
MQMTGFSQKPQESSTQRDSGWGFKEVPRTQKPKEARLNEKS